MAKKQSVILDDETVATMDDVDKRVGNALDELKAIATTGEAYMDEMMLDAEQKLRAIRQRIKRISKL